MLEWRMTVGIHLQSAQSPTPASLIPAWEQQPVTVGCWSRPEDNHLLPVGQRASEQTENGGLRGTGTWLTSAVREISCELWSIRRMSCWAGAPQQAEIVDLPVPLIQVRCTYDLSATQSWWTYSALHFYCSLQQMRAGVGLFWLL